MYKIDEEFRPPGRVFMKATRENPPGANPVPVPIRKSSLKKQIATTKGPAITTNLDDRRIQFKHEVKHEKTIEALITEYPPGDHYRSAASIGDEQSNRLLSSSSSSHHQSSSSGAAFTTENLHGKIPGKFSMVNGYFSGPPGGSGGDVSREVIHYSSSNKSGGGTGGAGAFDVPDGVTSLQSVTRNKRTSTEVLGSSFESKKLSQRASDGHRRITTHIVRKVTTLSRAEESAQAKNLVHTAHNKTTEFGYMTTQAIEPSRAKVQHNIVINIFFLLFFWLIYH